MTSFREIRARASDYFRFHKHELSGLFFAVLVTAFIFSFRDWGTDRFDALVGLTNLAIVFVIAAISFLFRISCQKIYGLAHGYLIEFKVWWVGLVIALVIAFVSLGKLPLILVGTASAVFMVKQRLGEFRYGLSNYQIAVMAFWGILGNLILAILFAIGLHLHPNSYFFGKGLAINLIMAVLALLPLPQLDGLKIFFGSRIQYILAIVTVIITILLLVTGTIFGIITATVIAIIWFIGYIITRSNK